MSTLIWIWVYKCLDSWSLVLSTSVTAPYLLLLQHVNFASSTDYSEIRCTNQMNTDNGLNPDLKSNQLSNHSNLSLIYFIVLSNIWNHRNNVEFKYKRILMSPFKQNTVLGQNSHLLLLEYFIFKDILVMKNQIYHQEKVVIWAEIHTIT